MFEEVREYTMTSAERVFALASAIDHVVAAEVPGAIVECGVWRGGSMMAVALRLQQLAAADRELFLFDTFEGMPEPGEVDVNVRGRAAADILAADPERLGGVAAVSPQEDVQRNIASTGYPSELIRFVRGKVEDTLPATSTGDIALLRLDTDWYESTRHELIHLWPRLVPGGILIIDDYGHWRGSQLAVDEYFSDCAAPVFLARIDASARLAVKR